MTSDTSVRYYDVSTFKLSLVLYLHHIHFKMALGIVRVTEKLHSLAVKNRTKPLPQPHSSFFSGKNVLQI